MADSKAGPPVTFQDGETALQFGVVADPESNLVYIKFSTPVYWFSFSKEVAIKLAETLMVMAEQLKDQTVH